MKRLIACASLVAVATIAIAPAHAQSHAQPKSATHHAQAAKHPAKKIAKAHPRCKVAPADEYFGRLKLSILGIRNTIKDQGLKIDGDPGKAPSTLSSIALTEDAIHDWQRKYPCDSWLPGTLLALERFYAKIHTEDGVRRVHATFAWLRHDYPRSGIVAVAKREDGQASASPPAPAVVPIAVPAMLPEASPSPAAVSNSAQAVAAPIDAVAPAQQKRRPPA